MENNKRIFGYDLIKTFAIFLIVFYHLGGMDYGVISPDTYYIPNLNKFLSSLSAAGVPLFLMVNGALVLPKQLNLKQTITKSLHLLFLLVFWKVVLQYLIANRLFSIQENMAHFWFLGTLAMVYIISFVLNRNKRLKILFLLFLFIYPFLSNFILDFFIYHQSESIPIYWNHTGFFTLYALLYFYLGYFLKEKDLSIILSICLILVGLLLINFEVVVMSNYYHIIFDGVNGAFPTFGALSLSMGFLMLLKDLTIANNMFKTAVTFIGRNTMGIYLFHVLIIFILRRFYSSLISDISPIIAVIISMCIILVTALFSEGINNSKGSFLINVKSSSLRSVYHHFHFSL